MIARIAPERPTPPMPDETHPRLSAPAVTLPTQAQIAARARQIYIQNGCKDGESEHNWFQAERELIEEMVAQTAQYFDEPESTDSYLYEEWELKPRARAYLRFPTRTEAA